MGQTNTIILGLGALAFGGIVALMVKNGMNNKERTKGGTRRKRNTSRRK